MPDTRPNAPRYLHEGDALAADATASVDVKDLLATLAERTEELAEARVRLQHAEDSLNRKTQEMDAERNALSVTRERLETDCAELEAELARERKARSAAEADLKRMRDRVGSLQHQLQIAWAQLQHGGAEAGQRPWWNRLGS